MAESRRNFVLAVLGILIGLFGGIPGYLSIRDYYYRSSVRIMFDEKESLPCFIINSPIRGINGSLAILLYGVTIVGEGNQAFVAYDVNLFLRSKGTWYKGVRFKPVQRNITDQSGKTIKAIQLYVGVTKPVSNKIDINRGKVSAGDILNICEWRDFVPGISVGFGEPAIFMVAAYFPNAPHDISKFDKMRIEVRDYLGNVYDEEIGTAGLRKPPFKLYLDQSLSKTNGARKQQDQGKF